MQWRMSLENNDDALLLLLGRVMIQLGTKDTAYKIQTKYAVAAVLTSKPNSSGFTPHLKRMKQGFRCSKLTGISAHAMWLQLVPRCI